MILVSTPPLLPLEATACLPSGPIKPAALGMIAREYVMAVREEICARQREGHGGLVAVATYTNAIDGLVRFVFDRARRAAVHRNPRLHERYTLVAQGGYGRGELNVHSDIDLLLLYPWKITPHIETVIEIVLYTLWDARLDVGHAVRNERECLRVAATDVKAKTALLDARHLCGDEPLYGRFDQTMMRELYTADQAAFIRDKLEERTSRHARAGRSVRLLQPELKEGQGGLRDLHTAMWMAKTRFRIRSMRQLVPLGILAEADMDALEMALDFLWRLRNAMHCAAGKHQDRLGFEQQDALAPELGFGEGPQGVEQLMRTYYRHATFVHDLSQRVIDRSSRPAGSYRSAASPVRVIGEGLRIRGASLSVTGREVFARRPALLAEVFLEAQRHRATLAPQTEALVRERVQSGGLDGGGTDAVAALRGILRQPRGVADTLDAMHRVGVLGLVLPEFGRLDCLVAHDPFHTYTVDQHTLMAVREIEALVLGLHAQEEPSLTRVAHELSRLDMTYLGMLCHDIGKGFGGDHSERGVELMAEVSRRLDLDVDEAAAATFLVRHHLLMSHLGQRRDIRDPELVEEFCRQVETVETLQRLVVVTYADMRAVGPGVWNAWRGGLVQELYWRAHEVLTRDTRLGTDAAARAMRIRERVLREADASEREALRAFLADMPDAYVLSTLEWMLPLHARLAAECAARQARGEDPPCATGHRIDPRGLAEVVVCTPDTPGLVAKCAAAFAAHGMSVMSARITTSPAGLAIDAFRLLWERGDDPEPWERLDRTLRRVLRGEVDVAELVDQASWRPTKSARTRGVSIAIDNEVSTSCTVIDVAVPDQRGLLFRITNALFELGLNVHLAKISTTMDRALDVIYVTDETGRKIRDPERLAAIEAGLEAALASADERMAAEGGGRG